ncbi:cupin domain-containing protein [Sphaerochaeta globosa]|uniref:Cupin 2 conserved barrel domain protein n=1 Tax=Sphaerochaeta globosa (strain ATCC BAA-1886 / DSM 22777 / Buddy) TaxID=158189 RepID=F0RSD6_SPHGB|nr:cupin domain-containing protein [Sphaerochaeta globosa]ADY14336.1 Cupin 2 conserved barrel domain protein [Sphaerochaeta globosa str. Buddy]
MAKKQYVYRIDDLPFTPLVEKEGIVTQFLLGDNIQISFIQNPPGATFPLHSHEAEQILIMLEGTEEHEIDGQKIHMEAGDVCIHPGNVMHGGVTLTGFKGIDIFSPPRTDKGGHVERMISYKTMPDSEGKYPANKIETKVPTWFKGVLAALRAKK